MKIFVSHAIADVDFFKKLESSLKTYGISLLIAEHVVSMTETTTRKIEKMIESSDAALIFLTQHGFDSGFVNQEIGYIHKAKIPYLQVVEKGLEDRKTGFIYGKDHITYDPGSPDIAINKITSRLTLFYSKKQKEKAMNQKILIGLGLLVGALFLMPDQDE